MIIVGGRGWEGSGGVELSTETEREIERPAVEKRPVYTLVQKEQQERGRRNRLLTSAESRRTCVHKTVIRRYCPVLCHPHYWH